MSEHQSSLPPDDVARTVTLADGEADSIPHVGLAGDTYTVLLDGKQTKGRYCLIDMHIPPGGGPPPHRHDFDESFTILAGEIQATCRGKEMTVSAGQTIHIPANAPHAFTNAASEPARLLCICAPAGQEEFFAQVGVRVDGRTTPPPTPSPEAAIQMKERAETLALKYNTEML